jgi:hypothetical protein
MKRTDIEWYLKQHHSNMNVVFFSCDEDYIHISHVELRGTKISCVYRCYSLAELSSYITGIEDCYRQITNEEKQQKQIELSQ